MLCSFRPRAFPHPSVTNTLCILIYVGSGAFSGLSHMDRLALVFEALHQGLAAAAVTTTVSSFDASIAASPLPNPSNTPSPSVSPRIDTSIPSVLARRPPAELTSSDRGRGGGSASSKIGRERGTNPGRLKSKHEDGVARSPSQNNSPRRDGDGVTAAAIQKGGMSLQLPPPRVALSECRGRVGGGVKASFLGRNVESLPVWGGLEWKMGSTLLVDCRTPAQWRAEDFRPSAEVRHLAFNVMAVVVGVMLSPLCASSEERKMRPRRGESARDLEEFVLYLAELGNECQTHLFTVHHRH